jgi:plastocyanin
LNAHAAGHVDQVDSLTKRELADVPEDEMIALRRPATAAVGLLLTALLAACGSSSSGGSTVTPGGAGSTSSSAPSTSAGPTVKIQNFMFNPSSLTVKPGTKVTFIQEDSVPHNATATGALAFHTPTMTQGQKYTVTFTKPGTYNYICTIHQYMHGTIVVS